MYRARKMLTATLATFAVLGCANAPSLPDGYEPVRPVVAASPQATTTDFPSGRVERGRYLVDLLGCGSCHTDGALLGEPDPARLLAGSGVGIATSDPMRVRSPAVVYPANLTPDRETGIGGWSVEQIVRMLQSGVDNHGNQALSVMPFATYSRLIPDDAEAIAMYLKSLPPVRHQVPSKVRAGQRARAPFVYFGVYRSER